MYLAISNIRTDDIPTSQQGGIIQGFPTPLAVIGAAFNWTKDLAQYDFDGVMYGYSSASTVLPRGWKKGNQKRRQPQMQPERVTRANEGKVIVDKNDTSTQSITFELIIKLKKKAKHNTGEGLVEVNELCQAISSSLLRVGGGSCVNRPKATPHEDVKAATRQLHGKTIVTVARPDLLARQNDEKVDTLDRLIRALSNKAKLGGWVIPTCIGYELISDVAQGRYQDYLDEGQPHAFVEPVLSLMELVSIKKLTEPKFWKYTPYTPDSTNLLLSQEV